MVIIQIARAGFCRTVQLPHPNRPWEKVTRDDLGWCIIQFTLHAQLERRRQRTSGFSTIAFGEWQSQDIEVWRLGTERMHVDVEMSARPTPAFFAVLYRHVKFRPTWERQRRNPASTAATITPSTHNLCCQRCSCTPCVPTSFREL